MRTCSACGEPNTPRARFCQACGRQLPAEAPVREVRKTVTVLFSDVAGSTGLGERLEAESLRRVMSGFFETMSAVVEGHGGSVEKFIGDALMAVFGVPVVHEDDALRALRAAVEMRAELRKLNEELERSHRVTLEVRTGINTGVVIAGSLVAGHTFVTGDSVNVAARLEQTAEPGEILLGDATFELVRDVVDVEPRGRIRLRGKQEEVVSYRLLDVRSGDTRTARGMRSPIVGRGGELTLLHQAVQLSASDKACYLFTVLGTAGVGKSRLTEEALGLLEDRPAVLSGRCLSYGEGITFWPIREMVWQACDIPADAEPATARHAIASRLRGEEHADRIGEGVGHLLGLAGASGTPEETSWGIRRFLEVLARDRPAVVVIDDIQWAEPGFLDLIEYLADFIRGPVLLVCLARRELLDVRPSWGAGRRNSMTITLSPLTDAESRTLVDNLLGGGRIDDHSRSHIVEASEGNPFFIEEIVRMLLDEGTLRLEGGRWVAAPDLDVPRVPATISALLASRLERLQEDERAVAERAAVVGKVFYWGAVAALSPEAQRPRVGRILQALVGKDLMAPDVSSLTGEDAFRFRHILIRDAAYQAIPKEQRAGLHERLARWIEDKVGDRLAEYEEIIGHHLERAYRYRRELGEGDEATSELALQAVDRLGSSGRRALSRRDVSAAATLLPRATDLLPEGHPVRVSLLPDLAQALIDQGDLRGAADVLEEARRTAARDRRAASHAELSRLWLRLFTQPEGTTEEIRRGVERILPVLREIGDERGLARAASLRVELDWMACRYREAQKGLEGVAAHAARIGDRRTEMEAVGRLAGAVLYGPSPVAAAFRRCQEIRSRGAGDRRVEASVQLTEAQLQAMSGRFEGVRDQIDAAAAILDDLGLEIVALNAREVRAGVEMLAGDPTAAEEALRPTYEGLERRGERGWLSTTAAELAHAIYAQGRYDEAERFAATSEEAGASDDVATQLLSKGARAKIAARRGRLEEGESLAREAVKLALTTDYLDLRGDTYVDLAEVLRLAGRATDAAGALDGAVREFESKGNIVSVSRARALRAELAAPASNGG